RTPDGGEPSARRRARSTAACWNRWRTCAPRRIGPALRSAAPFSNGLNALFPGTCRSGGLLHARALSLCAADLAAGQRHRFEHALVTERRLLVRQLAAVRQAWRGLALDCLVFVAHWNLLASS